ncbi:MAG: hypothetical protein U1E65_14800 [Myxococcota bacterium]
MRIGWPQLMLLLAGLFGCAGAPRTIKIPDSAILPPGKPGEPKKTEPYVVKWTDGRHVFEIKVPGSDKPGPFTASVPLDVEGSGAEAAPETAADQEIRQAREVPADAKKAEENSKKPLPSYLGTLAKVSALFRKKQFELALVELVNLEQSYPDDERLLEMKGTLYLRLKKPKLAKEAWERVLVLNPDNTIVAQALENLVGAP